VSIDKNYFKRQVPLLRKMVQLTKDPLAADRLSEMARDYEMKAKAGSEPEPLQTQDAEGDTGDGQEN